MYRVTYLNVPYCAFFFKNATNEANAITYLQTTDSDGFVSFQGLDLGSRYWVRVDTTLIHKINRSQVLKTGINEMNMTILRSFRIAQLQNSLWKLIVFI